MLTKNEYLYAIIVEVLVVNVSVGCDRVGSELVENEIARR